MTQFQNGICPRGRRVGLRPLTASPAALLPDAFALPPPVTRLAAFLRRAVSSVATFLPTAAAFSTALILATTAIFPTPAAHAATYYIAPTGGDDANDGSPGTPWATFNHAMTVLAPGDTLLLEDGIYYQTLDVTSSGDPGNPITVKAENDGQAIIDGQGARVPCKVFGSWSGTIRRNDIVLEGLVCRNSDADVVWIFNSDRVTARRVTAYNAGSGNVMVFNVAFSTEVLLEDCAAWGSGRKPYTMYASTDTTFRRCWGRWESHDRTPYTLFSVYSTSNSIVENCVGTILDTLPPDPGPDRNVAGIVIHSNQDGRTDNNKIYGNVILNNHEYPFRVVSEHLTVTGNHFLDNVAIVEDPANPGYGHFYQSGDNDLLAEHMTLVGFPGGSGVFYRIDGGGFEPDFAPHLTLKNSVILDGGWGMRVYDSSGTAVDNSFNDYWNLTEALYRDDASAGPGEVNVDPGFDVATYGRGGYLFVPAASPVKTAGEGGAQMGAEVLYRYEDGWLTGTPLWPWPMEDRIQAEAGASVTWELGGGMWKTLSGVYDDNSTDLAAFGFLADGNPGLARDSIGTVSGTDVSVTVPFATDVTSLAATFGTTGQSVTVGGAPQVNGTTTNDFTAPVIYTVHAADLSTEDYTVTVTIAPPVCPETLETDGCVEVGSAEIKLDERRAGRERLKAKWKKAAETLVQDDFGDPRNGSSIYGLCVYADDGSRVVKYEIDRGSGALCSGDSCWKSLSYRGWKYRDKLLEADGIDRIKVKGGSAGKGSANVKGANNTNKGFTELPLGVPAALESSAFATVQLRVDDGVCLTAALDTIKKQTTTEFSARK